MAFVTSAPDETLRQLQARLPLTGAGRPVGIITLEDIVEQVRAVRCGAVRCGAVRCGQHRATAEAALRADPQRHCWAGRLLV
jgi:hypothetical protein